jgi:hypothetical protein
MGDPIVINDTMKWYVDRVVAVHSLGGFCVWTGRAGIGKTTTAEYAVMRFEEAYNPDDPATFRAIHYNVSDATQGSNAPQKRAIRSLYFGLGCRVDEGFYRRALPEELAAEVVDHFSRMNVQIAFVDEAGGLSVEALRAFVLVSNTAHRMKWRLTVVFVGMDDLPRRMEKNNQVSRRIYDWCYFKPYTLEETYTPLKALHPFFAKSDLADAKHREHIQFIHNAYQGLPGHIVPFVGRFSRNLAELPDEDPAIHLEAAHVQLIFDRQRSIDDAKADYKGKFEAFDEQNGKRSGKSSKDAA